MEIGSKVKGEGVKGVLKAIVGNAAFIEVEPNVVRVCHMDTVSVDEPAPVIPADIPTDTPTRTATSAPVVEAPKKKASRKKKAE